MGSPRRHIRVTATGARCNKNDYESPCNETISLFVASHALLLDGSSLLVLPTLVRADLGQRGSVTTWGGRERRSVESTCFRQMRLTHAALPGDLTQQCTIRQSSMVLHQPYR